MSSDLTESIQISKSEKAASRTATIESTRPEGRSTGISDIKYLSANDLSRRWSCSRSQADRIARRQKLTRTYLGTGKNGMVRYLRSEIEKLEESCSLKSV